MSEVASQHPIQTNENLEIDAAIIAGGMLTGAAAGFAIAVTSEGMPINGDNNGKGHYTTAHTETGHSTGTPPMVEHTPLQEGTVAVMLVAGTLLGIAASRARRS